jgi:UDP-N-acetylmuramoylalanine--D-glutamate ligase
MNFLRDLPVLILGLGDSGLAMARWCVRFGAVVTVWDSRTAPPQAAALRAELPQVTLLHSLPLPLAGEGRGEGGDVAIAAGPTPSPQPSPASGRGRGSHTGFRLVLKSPGLAPCDERIAPLLQEARASAIAVLGELDLFVQALADLKAAQQYAPQVLAITGTNGKTTTTAMTALFVARAGKRVATAGNIGPTLLDTLAAQLDRQASCQESSEAPDGAPDGAPNESLNQAPNQAPDKTSGLPEVWVLELSSFQLEGGGTGVRGFEPHAATVLNISQDHLDWHGNLAAYQAAKARIFGEHALMVINRDDPAVEAMVPAPVVGKKDSKFSKPKLIEREVLRFGLDAPQRPGDFGIVEENGIAWLVRALPTDDTFKRKKGEEEEIHLQRLMPADAMRVRGRHNAANALAALALAHSTGCALAPMLHGLRDYAGEAHRVQPIGSVAGVEAFDDSKGTNVGATVAALLGLGADKSPAKLIVILGGDGKGQDFTPLTAPLSQHVRAVATIGRDAALIEAVVKGLPVQRHDTLQAAVAWCFAQAQPGDAVLLSPACASLDMFKNYAHRAEVFTQAVQALAADQGVVV